MLLPLLLLGGRRRTGPGLGLLLAFRSLICSDWDRTGPSFGLWTSLDMCGGSVHVMVHEPTCSHGSFIKPPLPTSHSTARWAEKRVNTLHTLLRTTLPHSANTPQSHTFPHSTTPPQPEHGRQAGWTNVLCCLLSLSVLYYPAVQYRLPLPWPSGLPLPACAWWRSLTNGTDAGRAGLGVGHSCCWKEGTCVDDRQTSQTNVNGWAWRRARAARRASTRVRRFLYIATPPVSVTPSSALYRRCAKHTLHLRQLPPPLDQPQVFKITTLCLDKTGRKTGRRTFCYVVPVSCLPFWLALFVRQGQDDIDV